MIARSPVPSGQSLLAVCATGLVRRYGPALALRGVDIRLSRGERVALLGPNGAGKTTLVRVLATALRPTGGSLAIDGVDALRAPSSARCRVGLVGERTYLYGDLTVRENLRFYGRLYGVERIEARIIAVLDEVSAGPLADRPVRTLSRGMQQRAALARAILHEPLVLLLDEPETGLDDLAQRRLADLLSRWAAAGRAVLVASHRLEWAQMVADRAILLRDGVVISEVTTPMDEPAALIAAYRAAIDRAQPHQALRQQLARALTSGQHAG